MDRRQKIVMWIIGFIFLVSFSVSVFAEESEEILELSQIEYEEPDGKAGYYMKKPKIAVNHIGGDNRTKVQLINQDNEITEEILDSENNRLCIQGERFSEGMNRLLVWQEAENGEEIPETRMEKEFRIDTQPPEKVEIRYEKEANGEVMYFSEKTYVEINAEDRISGVERIYCQKQGEEAQQIEAKEKVEIPMNFEGRITVWAEDVAGNKTTEFVSPKFVCENESPGIQFQSGGKLDEWNGREIVVKVGVYEKNISSGIAKIGCYLNGKLVKETVKIPQDTREQVISIPVKDTAELLVMAEDYAGNRATASKIFLVDTLSPQISIIGVEDKMITAEKVNVQCMVEDSQKIASAEMNIRKIDDNNVESNLPQPAWMKSEKCWETSLEFAEDGIYYIEVTGNDAAGNKIECKQRFVVDRTNPVIHYVENLQGKYLKEFRWNYPLTEFIQDFTQYTYEIRLDGKLRNLQILERREGKHLFAVKARDLAGNESEIKAEFLIDHTNPKIIFQGIESEAVYEEKVTVEISTELEGDEIEEIRIDGEKQKVENLERYQFVFEEIGEHEIFVKAKDKAENRASERVKFEIKEKPNVLEKVFHKSADIEKREPTIEEMEEGENQELPGIVLLVIVGCVGILAVGIVIYKKKVTIKR